MPKLAKPKAEFAWPTDLPSEDGVPKESPWHLNQMNLLIESMEVHWERRKDFYCGGNMFLYFSEKYRRSEDFRGPDFFVVKGVEHDKVREYWAVWQEEVSYPHVIVELLSESTRKVDLGIKKEIYEQTFRTPEYFCYDPSDETLMGWRLKNNRYAPIKPDRAGRLWSVELELWLGSWEGKFVRRSGRWIRFFTKAGKLVPTLAEREALGRSREQARADQEAARADQEAARAEQAEAEITRLKAELAQSRGRNGKHK